MLMDWRLSQIKPQFFKRTTRAQDFHLQLLTWALVEGGQCRLEVPKEKLGWEALWGDVEKQQLGELLSVVPLHTETAISLLPPTPP